jgi:hypothetical protein
LRTGRTAIDIEELNKLFDYCSATGEIIRKKSSGGFRKGTRAGSVTPSGSRAVRINRASYSEASVAYAIYCGEWPDREPIHINGDASDNSAANLMLPGVCHPPESLLVLSRFGEEWRKTLAHLVVIQDSGCIEFVRNRDQNGYGRVHQMLAHRWSLLLCGIDIADKCVLHRCDNPPCVNPDHLFVGTQQDNIADAMAKGRIPKGDRHWTKRLKAA